MSFAIFVTWVLVGVSVGLLAGFVRKRGGYGLKNDVILGLVGSIGLSVVLRMVGVLAGTGVVVGAISACIGAGVAIGVQRRFWRTQNVGDEKTSIKMWRWALGAVVVLVTAWMTLGPAPQPVATAAVVEEKTYTVTPAAIKIKAGIVTGEMTEMKVTERIEQGSGRVVAPAKFTARLLLKNSSENQTVRLVAGKIRYIDGQGQQIKLEDARTEPTLKFASYSTDRLDPGQEATEGVDVDFPADALTAAKLKDIRLDLTYIPSPYRVEMVHFGVSVSAQR